ncbi:MAG: hypothetical protein IKU87_02435 [Clostridia bacterium]|nr:hypothetical protein [Clostridia bacterium]
MFLFTKELPRVISVCGEDFEINTDFKVWIEFDRLMTESSLSDSDKIAKILNLCLKDKILPKRLDETLFSLFKFYSCFEDEKSGSKGKEKKSKRVISFSHDAPYIYSAFYGQYGIDLLSSNLHWFCFRALLDGLTDEHKLISIIGYRKAELSDVKDAKRRAFLKKMKAVYSLPDRRTEEQIEKDTLESLSKVI